MPVTFQVTSGGNIISDTNTLLLMQAVFNGPANGACQASATPYPGSMPQTLYQSPEGATGSSDFRFLTNSESFRLNWDTTDGTSGKGCYTVLIWLDDDPALNPRMTPNAVELR